MWAKESMGKSVPEGTLAATKQLVVFPIDLKPKLIDGDTFGNI